MKVASIGNKKISQRGSSILEVLIAIAVLTLGISAATMLTFASQSLEVDTDTSHEALFKARKVLEDTRAQSRENFSLVTETLPTPDGDIYTKQLLIPIEVECSKTVTSRITWDVSPARPQTIELTTLLGDVAGTLALGGDCVIEPPLGDWNPPALFARDTINPGKFSSLDTLERISYLGSDDTEPYLFIADTRNAVLNNSSNQPLIIGDSIPYDNAFNSSGDVIDEINSIDAFKDTASGKTYAFIAMASSTAQLAVIDVTDIRNPVLVAKRKLKNITATNSTAWGWRLYYYDGKLYINSKETAGPEFHVFDVPAMLVNPENPEPTDPSANEIGSGIQLTGGIGVNGTTVEDLVVRDGIAYFAAQKNTLELLVYDVSDPLSIQHLPGASQNLPGNEDGRSIFLVGNKLYLGRDKASGPEFYIFDASNPQTAVGGLPIFGPSDPNKEMNKDITDIRVAGRFAFLASYGDSSGGFKVWDISQPANIQSVYLNFNFGNKLRAIDYEADYIYATGESTPNFQMLYSP